MPRARRVAWAIVSLGFSLASCAGRVEPGSDAGADSATIDTEAIDTAPRTDATAQDESPRADARVDTGTRAECETPVDCEIRSARPSIAWCRGSEGWSCLEGRCTWECEAGRICRRESNGCVSCIHPPMAAVVETCPSAPCDPPTSIVEGLSAMPITCEAPELPPAACFGRFFRDRDGQLCSWQMLPTGAIRMAVSCGICVTVYGP